MLGQASAIASSAGATDPAQSLMFELAARPTAGPAAGRAPLADRGTLPTPVRDDVLLLLTELVNNAVRHANAGGDRPVRVELHHRARTVSVAVFDQGTGFTAEPPHSQRDKSGGLGLFLVDQIADRWGITPTGSGTCVWLEIQCEQ
jgi:anti-sigma regulatory factor (Ser/Thr protein kinase)